MAVGGVWVYIGAAKNRTVMLQFQVLPETPAHSQTLRLGLGKTAQAAVQVLPETPVGYRMLRWGFSGFGHFLWRTGHSGQKPDAPVGVLGFWKFGIFRESLWDGFDSAKSSCDTYQHVINIPLDSTAFLYSIKIKKCLFLSLSTSCQIFSTL